VIVDTSAVIAILRREAEGPGFFDRVVDAERPAMSAVALVEAAMVVEGRGGRQAGADLDNFLAEAGVEIVAVTADTARLAREAWRIWGKGNHPARLNLGDCFSYALARERGEPLLFKGEDFARTDVRRAL
jgi:ribonuclease VapC